jgi:hypothetical protein
MTRNLPNSSSAPEAQFAERIVTGDVVAHRGYRKACCAIAVALVVAFSGLAALITARQSSARTIVTAKSAQLTSNPNVRHSEASAARVTQQQLQNAKAKYAKLKANVKKRIGQLKTRYAKLLSELKACEDANDPDSPANPACLLAVQANMAKYEAFLETASAVISSWVGGIGKILQNIH